MQLFLDQGKDKIGIYLTLTRIHQFPVNKQHFFKMKKTKLSLHIPVIIGILILTFSCATSPYKKLSTSNVQYVALLDPGTKILILPATVSYEAVDNESKIDPGQEGEQIRALLETTAAGFFSSKNINMKYAASIITGPEEQMDDLSRVISSSGMLFKAYPGDALVNTVKNIGKETGFDAILVLACDVKVGTGGTWNSYTGAITSKNDRTIFKAVLLKTPDCSKIWSNDVQLRKLPRMGSTDFNNAINSIFTNLKLKGE